MGKITVWMGFARLDFTKQENMLFNRTKVGNFLVSSWSSFVEGDEQLYGPKSQTTMEFFQACVI